MLSTLCRVWARQTRRDRRPLSLAGRAFRPRLEPLEDRTVPSTVTWTSTTSGDWADGANWSSGSTPGVNDDVVIDVVGVTVTHSSGSDSVHSLTTSSDLALTGGSIAFSTTCKVDGTLELNGGTLDLLNKTLDGSGTVTNQSGSSWTLTHSVIKPSLVNQGILEARSGVDIQGRFSNQNGATLREVGDGTGTVDFQVLRVANGFTNDGLIELTGNTGYISSLGVTSGTLTNASDGTIHALAGNGGGRTLNAQLDNEGTLTVDAALNVNLGSNASAVNNGTITLGDGDLSFNGTDSTTTVTNSGTLSIGSGRTLSVQSGGTQFSHTGGSITGTGTLHLNGVSASFTGDFNTNGVNLYLENSTTYGSTGTLTVSADSTLTLFRSPTVAATVENAGTVLAEGSPSITGTYTSDAGSTIRVLGNRWTFGSTLTLAGGFTNHGLIQLSSVDGAYGAALALSTGTLTNGSDGTIDVLAGTGGSRSITADLDNQGSLSLHASLLTVTGNFTQESGGSLSVAVGGTQAGTNYGQLAVSGTASLDGTLSVNLVNGFTPVRGTGFQVVTFPAGNGSGTFATLDDGGVFTASYNTGDVTLVAN
jgi:hypothetical protein